MFLVRWFYYPILEKTGEMRSVLKEFVEGQQDQGVACACIQQSFSQVGPVLSLGVLYRDLAAEEEHRRSYREDPVVRAANERVNSLSRAPSIRELWDDVVHVNPGAPYRYMGLAYFHPAIGKAGELEKLMAEQVKLDQSRIRVGLQRA